MIEQAAKRKRINLKHVHEWLTWKVVLVISIIFLACFGVGLKFDYQISNTMYNHLSHGGKMAAQIINCYLVCGFTVLAISLGWVFVLSCFTYKHDKIWIAILGSVFGFAIMGGFGFYAYLCMYPFTEHTIYGEKAGMIHNIVLLIVIGLGSFIFTMIFFGDTLNKDMCKRTFTYLLEVAIYVGVLVILKSLWSRPTPVNAFTPNEHFFKNWWEIRPFFCFKEGELVDMQFWSSPAGFGCQSAIVLFAVTSTLELTKKYDVRKLHTIFFYLGASFCTVVMFMRIMAGETFFTDASLSMAFGIWTSFILKKVAKIVRKKFYGHAE